MSEPTPLISVIVPTYRPGDGIDRVVTSLDAQTLPQDRFEVILIDDGSPDDTLQRLQVLAATRPNYRVERIENSGWPSRPRNVATRLARGDYVLYMDHDDSLYPDGLRRAHEYAAAAGLDGVVAKRTDAPYTPGRRTMLKIKHERTADAVVIGYGLSRNGSGVGSLHLGLYDDGALVHVGGIGAFPDAARAQLAGVLAPLVLTGAEADAAPRPNKVSRLGPRDFVPIRPDLVVEVAFDQLEGKRFRHAVTFRRWRPDREPESCLLEQVERAPAYDLAAVLRG